MAPEAKATKEKAAAVNVVPPTENMLLLTLKVQVVFASIRSTVVVSQDQFAKLTEYCEKFNTNIIGCMAHRPAGVRTDGSAGSTPWTSAPRSSMPCSTRRESRGMTLRT